MAMKLNGKKVTGKADVSKAKGIKRQQTNPLLQKWDEQRERRQEQANEQASRVDEIMSSVQKRWDERKTQRAYDRIVGEAAKRLPGDLGTYKYNYAPPSMQTNGNFRGGISNVSQQSSGKMYSLAQDQMRAQWKRNHPQAEDPLKAEQSAMAQNDPEAYKAYQEQQARYNEYLAKIRQMKAYEGIAADAQKGIDDLNARLNFIPEEQRETGIRGITSEYARNSEYRTQMDRQFYDAFAGAGAYDKAMAGFKDDEEGRKQKQELQDKIDQAWSAYEDGDTGKASEILGGKNMYAGYQNRLNTYQTAAKKTEESLNNNYKDVEETPWVQYGMTEGQYMRELQQGLERGEYDPATAKEIQQYLYYHQMPDRANSRAYSDYIQQGIEQGIFDDMGEITMMSEEALRNKNAALTERLNAKKANRQNADEINAELVEVKGQGDLYDSLQEHGLYDPDTGAYYRRKPQLEEVEDQLIGKAWYSPENVETHYDALMYNAVHGEGAYENILNNGTDDEYEAMEAEIADLWARMENGTISELGQNPERVAREQELMDMSQHGSDAVLARMQREIDKNNEELKRRELIGQYSTAAGGYAGYDPSMVDPDLELEYAANMELRGGNKLPQHDQANFMYWVLNKYIPSQERDYGESFTAERWELSQAENKYRKYSFMTEEMLGEYNSLYTQGLTAAAEEYLKALDPYLTQMASSRAQELRYEAAKGPYGGWYGAATVVKQPWAGLKGTIGSLAALMGDKTAADVNSFWYTEQRQNNTVRGARAEVWGDFFAEKFGEQYRDAGKWWNGVVYSTADNLMAMALTKGAGNLMNFDMASKTAMRMIQTIMSSSAASSTMVEKLEKGMEPAEAALYALGSGYIEAITEKYSIEALFSANVRDLLGHPKDLAKYLLKQFIPESTEEGASNILSTAFDTLMSKAFGHESEMEAEYNALVQQGVSKEAASRQVWGNWKDQLLSEMLAGGVSGLFLGADVVVANAMTSRQVGSQINKKTNIVGSQEAGYLSGVQQLVTAAKGLGIDTESYKLATEMDQEIQEGKTPSNRKTGNLARLIMAESSPEIGQAASTVIERDVRERLKELGMDPEAINAVAGAITKAAINESQAELTKEEIEAIAKDKRAIDVLGSYLTDAGKKTTRKLKEMAAPEAAKAQKTVKRLVTGQSNINLLESLGKVSSLAKYAPIATEEEIGEAKKGRFLNNGLDAVWNGERVQIVGRKGDNYLVMTEDGQKEAKRADVKAAGEALGVLMEYADRNGKAVMDETFDALLSGLKDNPKMGSAEYITSAINAYIQYRTGGDVKNSDLSPETLKTLQANAQRMNEKWDNETRLRNEKAKPTPGKGVVRFLGAEYGTAEWNKNTRKYGAETRRQARLLAEIGARLGNRMDIVYDENQPDVFGWDDENGVIVINIAAENEVGSGMHRHVLTVAAHELTHWLERNSPKQYVELRNYVFSQLRKNGVDVGMLVNSKIDNFRAVMDRDMSIEEAMAEIVADACDQVLTSDTVAKTLQNEHPNLYTQVKKFAKNFVELLRKNTKDAEGNTITDSSYESRMIASGGQQAIEDLAKVWLGARAEALGRQATQAQPAEAAPAKQQSTRQVITQDNQGRELSPQQQEYFSRSKVIDENGNLLRMYHGTKAEFYTFDRDMIGSTGRFEGSGFNFTPYEGRAKSYGGNVMAGYLNIQNPLSSKEKTITVSKLAQLIREADPTGDNIIADYARETRDYGKPSFVARESMTTARSVWESSDNDVDIYSFISAADSDAISLIETFEKMGYDGLIHYDDNGRVKTAVAFNSNQFKSVDNTTPTSSEDIRYSVRQDEINPHGMEIDPEYSVHPESEQFSVRQITRAAKLEMIEGDDTLTIYMESENGKKVKGLDPDKKYVVVDGVKVKITPEMIKTTPVGMLIDMGLSDKAYTQKDGTKTTQKKAAMKMFADLMNLCAKYKDHHLIWEIAGSEFAESFSALKGNADPQYGDTVDFGTICSKTQAIIDVLSETMLERVKTMKARGEVFRGLDRRDVMMVYDKTHNAKLSVPCPVCYVFSRWMGVPSLLGQMNQFQHDYVVTAKVNGKTVYDENGDAVINWEETEKTAAEYVQKMLEKYGSKKGLAEEKTKIAEKIKRRENSLPKLNERLLNQQRKLKNERMTPAKQRNLEAAIKRTENAIKQNIADTDQLMEDIREMEGYNWVTQALGSVDENGKYTVDRTFRITPEEILFDLNRTGEFAGYKHNWAYRTSRGAGMGKAIMPYSGAEIGDIIHGEARRWKLDMNPFLTMNRKEAERAFESAKKRVRQQNMVGGQRFQSTSDFRPEWGLDYLLSFLEMQALGSKVQMYTKVAEAVDFLGSIGADVNQSIMGSGNGWHIATAEEIEKAKTDKALAGRMGVTYDEHGAEHTYVLDFSDVTGMNYKTALANTKKYNSVQMILVGMNDIHIRLAIGNDDIDFVIPWHSSGNSKDVLQQLVAVLKPEELTESNDYTDFQTDRKKGHEIREGKKKTFIDDRTQAEKDLWDARVKLLSEGEKKLTEEERRTLEKNKYTRELLRRFSEGGEHAGIILPKAQAEQVFPYEYWDKTSTRENADVNGERFAEYCDALGLVPRFNQFKNEHGYWKLLIDRKMYENNVLNEDGTVKEWGKYREQQVVDVTKAEIGQLPDSTTAKYRRRDGAYSEETQNAVMAAKAALAEKYDVEPRYNPYDNQKAEAEGTGEKQMSIRSGDIEIARWMAGLTASSLKTEQERVMLKQWQDLYKSLELDRHAIRQREQELNKLRAKQNPTAYDRQEIDRKERELEKWQALRDAKEKQIAKATSEKGFAKIMFENRKLMDDLANGRTADEVRATVDAISAELGTVTKEMEERSERLKDLAKKEAVIRVRQQLNSAGLKRIAAKLKADLNSELSNTEIENRLALMALKMKEGRVDEEDVTELADMLVGKMRRSYDSYILDELRGRTITLSQSQQKELRGQNRTLREIRQELAGTGIRIDTKGKNTLDKNWSELCDLIPVLDRGAADKDMLDKLLNVVSAEKNAARQQYGENMDMQVASMVIDAASDLVPEIVTDKKSMQLIRETMNFISEMSREAGESAEAIDELNSLMARLQKKGQTAKSTLGSLENRITDAIAYNNLLTVQSEASTWAGERRKIINLLNDEHTKDMLRQQEEFRQKIEKDKNARKMMADNLALRRQINTNIGRVRQLLMHESTLKNIPEHMKGIAREMVAEIVNNDLSGRKISGMSPEDLTETARVLAAMEAQDGAYNPDELKNMDEAMQDILFNALDDIRAGIDFYNASTKGEKLEVNLQAFKNALTRISEGVSAITSIINAERTIALGDRKVAVQDQAYKVQESTGNRRAKERTGKIGTAINTLHKAVISGNLTPEYFFKMLKNAGLSDLWEEYHRAENRNGLLLAQAKSKLAGIAEKYGYAGWDMNQRVTVPMKNGDVSMTIGQLMSLYATWTREHTLGPAMSNHLGYGGFYVEEFDPKEGWYGKQALQRKAHRMADEDIAKVEGLLTQEQIQFVNDVVAYMSNDMSRIGNEASMKAYGIKMYKESYYFPFKMWDGVKSRASNDSGSAAKQDRAFHPSFSKTRLHGANNALIIGDFMTTAADHIVGMINYATMGLANESLQKVLNQQVPEGERLDQMTKRNIRTVIEEAYGREAMSYLLKLQEQLNGGAVQVEKSLGDRAISLFRKNAVAGSLSVTAQQPLSYLRAAMMIDPKYLIAAMSPQYWKGSAAEMQAHSGVAVIKQMGRFDMGFGQSAREYVTPEGRETKLQKVWNTITEKATELPEKADLATWTRMWSAVKMEQHDLHPNMDMTSDEFLDMCGERFNDVMRKTQVYDSTLTKSMNMRSQNYFTKSITSFMAEPTLTLNVLADAIQTAGEKGGKMRLARAGAIFLMSAAAQAAVKAIMSTGRSPDDKKTWEENFWYRFTANIISEGNPMNLVPGYNDVITLLKEGELKDDAMGAIGKIFTAWEKGKDLFTEGFSYRTVEDSAGQLAQLFTKLPLKNLMRDARAMYNWFIGRPYADERETSRAVLRQQALASVMNADNLLGVINAKLGEAGYKVTNNAYYDRMYNAIQEGNQAEADEIREYLEKGKGVKPEKIDSAMRSNSKTKLSEALDSNKSAEITEAVKEMRTFGAEVKTVKSELTTLMKAKYQAANAADRVRMRNAMQIAYKALGLTAADADKIIDGWMKDTGNTGSNNASSTVKDTTGRYGRGNIDLNNRKVVRNADGSISTERSFSVNINGKEVLLPTVINGKVVSEEEAIEHYYQTGKYLGKFDTVREATEYAQKLHERQDWYYNK